MAFGFDSNLPLSMMPRPPPEASFNETLRTMADLATHRTQQQQAQIQLSDMLRKQQQEQTLEEIYRANADTPELMPGAMLRRGLGPQAMAWRDQAAEMAGKAALRNKALEEVKRAQRQRVGELFYDVKDQAGHDAALQELASDPDPMIAMYAGKIPKTFDLAVAQRLGNLAVPAVERAKLAARSEAPVIVIGKDGTQYIQDKRDPNAPAKVIRDEQGNPIKKRPPGGGAGGVGGGGAEQLTPEALDAQARLYNTTRELPPLGAGRAGLAQRIRIINRAIEIDPARDLASSSASYRADVASLKKLQTSSDAINSFEGAAEKNLDTFMELSKGLVDTGSPFLNVAARHWDEEIRGNPAMAGISAARATAINEIGKVLSGATGGAALTEGARKEVEELMKKGATIAQLRSAATVLKRDMANRKTAVAEQLAEIQGRISGKPKAAEGAAGTKTDPKIAAARKWLSDPKNGTPEQRKAVEAKLQAVGASP